MLSRLQIKNYVLIDSLEIDFPEGLIIITGQTGAGKSILLGALSLVTGAKADPTMVSEGADNCVIEAEFDCKDESLLPLLEENEVEWDGGHLIIRRIVNKSGRSRAFVNDSPVPVTLLQDIAMRLIDIHSQHQTLLLSDKHFQLDVLDYYAGNMELRDKCASLWKELSAQKSALSQVESRIARIASEKDYNEAQFNQLDSASLTEGELAELEEEQKRLANAEEIKMGLCSIESILAPEEGLSLEGSLKECEKILAKLGRYLSSADDLSSRIESCRLEMDDILSEVIDQNSRVDISQERLEEVENRMSLIYGLLKKHGCADESELIALRDRLSEELFDSTRLEEEAQELRNAISSLESSLDKTASQLHSRRIDVAQEFSDAVTDSLQYMELQFASFIADVTDTQMSSTGKDQVVFRFSATGKNPVELSKCASGGEMSRIMLSLKSMMATYMDMPTMIFDEIDTGVSGSVADKMGTMICRMGENMQVFAITHLPQVAAKGKAHYLVSKTIDPITSKATSTITLLNDDGRVMEVARMLSGSVITDAAIDNAKSLLV